MLGEEEPYAYCDDNDYEVMMDSYGINLQGAAGAVIGAVKMFITGGIAATVTGQKYTLKDMMAIPRMSAIAKWL